MKNFSKGATGIVALVSAALGMIYLLYGAAEKGDVTAKYGLALAVIFICGFVLADGIRIKQLGVISGSEAKDAPGFDGIQVNGNVGLLQVHSDASTYDLTDAILKPDRLFIVLNDGRTWLSVHRDRLRRRLSDSTKLTTIFLIHPDSEFLSILARKGSTDAGTLRTKVAESLEIISKIRKEDSQLEVLGHHLFNTYSLVIGDDSAVAMPYFLSRGGRTVPAFVYQKLSGDCYFQDLVKDIRRLRIDASDIESYFTNGDLQATSASNVMVMPIAQK